MHFPPPTKYLTYDRFTREIARIYYYPLYFYWEWAFTFPYRQQHGHVSQWVLWIFVVHLNIIFANKKVGYQRIIIIKSNSKCGSIRTRVEIIVVQIFNQKVCESKSVSFISGTKQALQTTAVITFTSICGRLYQSSD